MTKWMLLVALSLPTLSATAQTNWADSKESYTQSPEFNQSKAICARLRNLTPPEKDKPSAQEMSSLKGCSSEDLYYGIGQKADPVRARKCAFYEQESGEDLSFFSGATMLMTIYANGRGADRNLDVATALACNIDGAPAESDGRVKHLQELKTKGTGKRNFDVCDDITSGLAGGMCEAHAAKVAETKREGGITHLQRNWTADQSQAFTPLQQAMNTYINASGRNEVDMTGTSRAALVINHEQKLKNAFSHMIETLEKGHGVPANIPPLSSVDTEMNASYKKLMAHDDPVYGTVTRKGIRTAQRAWLTYRDAWVTFAHKRYPTLDTDRLNAWLTHDRLHELKQFI